MLKVGDIILYDYYDKSLPWWQKVFYKLQSWFDRGRAHHSAIYIGDGKILDTQINVGVRIRKYYKYEGKQKIYRVLSKYNTNSKEVSYSINKYYEKHKELPYSIKDYIKVIFYKIFKLKLILKNSPVEDICSGLVYEIYKNLGFDKKLILTPNDFQRTDFLYTIKDWD